MPEPIEQINSDTPTKDVIAQAEGLLACAEAIDWYRHFTDVPFGESIDAVLADTTANPSWTAWFLTILGEKIDPEPRKRLLGKIRDPMMAFSLYLGCEWLTDEEDQLLEAKFKGKLPAAEAELAQGIMSRRKTA